MFKRGNSKVVVKLDEKDKEMIKNAQACKTVCEKLVRTVVKEFELADMQETAIWDALTKKYKLDVSKFIYSYDAENVTQVRTVEENKLDQMIADLTKSSEIRKYVFEKMGVK